MFVWNARLNVEPRRLRMLVVDAKCYGEATARHLQSTSRFASFLDAAARDHPGPDITEL